MEHLKVDHRGNGEYSTSMLHARINKPQFLLYNQGASSNR